MDPVLLSIRTSTLSSALMCWEVAMAVLDLVLRTRWLAISPTLLAFLF